MSVRTFSVVLALLAVASVRATDLERLIALFSDYDTDKCFARVGDNNASLQYLPKTYLAGPTNASKYYFSFCDYANVTSSSANTTYCGGKAYFAEIFESADGKTCTDTNEVTLLNQIAYNNATKTLEANYTGSSRAMLRLYVDCLENSTTILQVVNNVTSTTDGAMTVFSARFASATVCPTYTGRVTTTTAAPAAEPFSLSTGAIVGIVVAVVVVGVVVVAICRKSGGSSNSADTKQSNSPYKPMDNKV